MENKQATYQRRLSSITEAFKKATFIASVLGWVTSPVLNVFRFMNQRRIELWPLFYFLFTKLVPDNILIITVFLDFCYF